MNALIRSIVLIAAGLMLAGCSFSSEVASATSPPLTIEEKEGSEISRLTLSEKAASRLGIETVAVAEEAAGGATAAVIPYAAVLYDADGETWAYTSPERLVFVRAPIVVERIEGDVAILESGPPTGTLVVAVGGAELWGAEHGVGGGH